MTEFHARDTSYHDRDELRPPKGFEMIGAEGESIVQAKARLRYADFSRPLRVVEPAAIVEGVEHGRFLTSDPGEDVALTERLVHGIRPVGGLSVAIERGLCWHGGVFYRLNPSEYGAAAKTLEGDFHSLATGTSFTSGAKVKASAASGVDLWRAALELIEGGFSWDEIESAFAKYGPAVAALKGACGSAIESVIGDLSPRDRNAYYRRAAEAELLAEYTADDYGPEAAAIFVDALRSTLAGCSIADLPALEEKLTVGSGVDSLRGELAS